VLILIEFKIFRINTYASADSKDFVPAGWHSQKRVGTKRTPGHLKLPRDSVTEGLSRVREKIVGGDERDKGPRKRKKANGL
jgi:hypothetical protein